MADIFVVIRQALLNRDFDQFLACSGVGFFRVIYGRAFLYGQYTQGERSAVGRQTPQAVEHGAAIVEIVFYQLAVAVQPCNIAAVLDVEYTAIALVG